MPLDMTPALAASVAVTNPLEGLRKVRTDIGAIFFSHMLRRENIAAAAAEKLEGLIHTYFAYAYKLPIEKTFIFISPIQRDLHALPQLHKIFVDTYRNWADGQPIDTRACLEKNLLGGLANTHPFYLDAIDKFIAHAHEIYAGNTAASFGTRYDLSFVMKKLTELSNFAFIQPRLRVFFGIVRAAAQPPHKLPAQKLIEPILAHAETQQGDGWNAMLAEELIDHVRGNLKDGKNIADTEKLLARILGYVAQIRGPASARLCLRTFFDLTREAGRKLPGFDASEAMPSVLQSIKTRQGDDWRVLESEQLIRHAGCVLAEEGKDSAAFDAYTPLIEERISRIADDARMMVGVQKYFTLLAQAQPATAQGRIASFSARLQNSETPRDKQIIMEGLLSACDSYAASTHARDDATLIALAQAVTIMDSCRPYIQSADLKTAKDTVCNYARELVVVHSHTSPDVTKVWESLKGENPLEAARAHFSTLIFQDPAKRLKSRTDFALANQRYDLMEKAVERFEAAKELVSTDNLYAFLEEIKDMMRERSHINNCDECYHWVMRKSTEMDVAHGYTLSAKHRPNVPQPATVAWQQATPA